MLHQWFSHCIGTRNICDACYKYKLPPKPRDSDPVALRCTLINIAGEIDADGTLSHDIEKLSTFSDWKSGDLERGTALETGTSLILPSSLKVSGR